MKKKKIDRLVSLIDPEPRDCMGTGCGFEVLHRSGTVLDVLAKPEIFPAPRNTPEDYKQHRPNCPWGLWAMREFVRTTNKLIW